MFYRLFVASNDKVTKAREQKTNKEMNREKRRKPHSTAIFRAGFGVERELVKSR